MPQTVMSGSLPEGLGVRRGARRRPEGAFAMTRKMLQYNIPN